MPKISFSQELYWYILQVLHQKSSSTPVFYQLPHCWKPCHVWPIYQWFVTLCWSLQLQDYSWLVKEICHATWLVVEAATCGMSLDLDDYVMGAELFLSVDMLWLQGLSVFTIHLDARESHIQWQVYGQNQPKAAQHRVSPASRKKKAPEDSIDCTPTQNAHCLRQVQRLKWESPRISSWKEGIPACICDKIFKFFYSCVYLW